MAEYIERERLLRDPYFQEDRYPESHLLRMAVMNQPAADVVPVVRGRWELHKDGSGTCDRCHGTQKDVWDFDTWQNYCGRCGAKMEGAEIG